MAERANISRSTLIKLEQGAGTKLETFLAVGKVLGIADRVIQAVDPLNTDLGRARSYMLGRQRAPEARELTVEAEDYETAYQKVEESLA